MMTGTIRTETLAVPGCDICQRHVARIAQFRGDLANAARRRSAARSLRTITKVDAEISTSRNCITDAQESMRQHLSEHR
jgi:hypothetical protein